MHLLLVEDDRQSASYLRQGLSESGYVVEVVERGDTALDLASRVEFDVIVLDIMIPGIDGFAVCRALRRKKRQMPIIMLTARDAVDDRIQGLDAGADDYLVKPFSFKELEARIRALLRRAPGLGSGSVISVADLNFDTRTRTVTRSGRTVDLTAKELLILECLMRDIDRVFTREQIAQHVWGLDAPTGSNIIDVYIRNLRRKLDDRQTVKLIQTVKGLGYRISERTD